MIWVVEGLRNLGDKESSSKTNLRTNSL